MEIIWLRSQGLTMEELAGRYHVSKSLVKALFVGKLWKHITARLTFHLTAREQAVAQGRNAHKEAALFSRSAWVLAEKSELNRQDEGRRAGSRVLKLMVALVS